METKQLTVLTKKDMTKAENTILSTKQLNFLFQETPKSHIYKRPGKGGQTWDFVTGTYMKKVLNLMFGWDWDFKVIKFDVMMDAKQCLVLGELTCRTKEKTVIKMQFGRADIKFKRDAVDVPLDLGNDLKAATTDSLKKCAAELGIASDIYGKNEFKAIKIVDQKPTPDQLYLLDELIDQSKLNNTEIDRIKFSLPTDSATEVSIKIDGLKKFIESGEGISCAENHLDSIQKEIDFNKE